eukprot:CAMPEP_0114627738 /NCGR_PEP_ID=MMETSP0168-20121206/12455_1 /TAXON_ID=95228 ORGANISM="Vannella sp., Strain DIVA3 517/6/12" /NCGR_SAMPLE_ID=MMETSP0168 /ASSEMBLY_ACC=CAM_ASM_000044 /LENGTH=48 /DNA_ID= /DNA_START= /DNA_END= /DNA_ORIENTATION=
MKPLQQSQFMATGYHSSRRSWSRSALSMLFISCSMSILVCDAAAAAAE